MSFIVTRPKFPPPPLHRSLAYLSQKTGQTTLWTEKIAVRTVIEIRLTEHVLHKNIESCTYLNCRVTKQSRRTSSALYPRPRVTHLNETKNSFFAFKHCPRAYIP